MTYIPERDYADKALSRAEGLVEDIQDHAKRDALKLELLLSEARMHAVREIDDDLAYCLTILQSHGNDLVQVLGEDCEDDEVETAVSVNQVDEPFSERGRVDEILREAEGLLEKSAFLSDGDKQVWRVRLELAKAEIHQLRDLDDDVGHTAETIDSHGSAVGSALGAFRKSLWDKIAELGNGKRHRFGRD